jgi:uncharacterized protein (DUF2237 family)
MPAEDKNVLGGRLSACSLTPRTGFYRDGCCNTGAEDLGLHVVCAQVTAEFLEFAREHGNDLITPMPAYGFPGLSPGDRWCVCAGTWRQAFEAGRCPSGDVGGNARGNARRGAVVRAQGARARHALSGSRGRTPSATRESTWAGGGRLSPQAARRSLAERSQSKRPTEVGLLP